MTSTDSPDKYPEDCDDIKDNPKRRIDCEEKKLESLLNTYTRLMRPLDYSYDSDDKSTSKEPKKRRLYPARVAACVSAFVISLIISFVVFPLVPYMVSSVNIGVLSLITGITIGIVMAVIFVIEDILKTQSLNEELSAISFEIRTKRSKILLLLQQEAMEGSGDKSTDISGDEGGGSGSVESMIHQAKENNKTLREVDKLSDLKKDTS